MEATTDVQVTQKRNFVGISRNGQPIGHANRTSGKVEQWTARIYTDTPPFEIVRPGFDTADHAAQFIAEHGVAR